MKKSKAKKIPGKFTLDIDLQYGGQAQNNDKQIIFKTGDVLPIITNQNILRCNFLFELRMTNKTMQQVFEMLADITQSEKIQKLTKSSQELQEYMLSMTKDMSRGYNSPGGQIVKTDFPYEAWVKGKLMYHTNMYVALGAGVDGVEFEKGLLQHVQFMLNDGLGEFITINAHYKCWGYFFDDSRRSQSNPQEFIIHRLSGI